MESMESCVRTKLGQLGYHVHTKPYEYIEEANRWYRNELIDDFHKRTAVTGELYEIDRMNFAKRGCADDANLCEIIDINVGDDVQNEFIHAVLKITDLIQCIASSWKECQQQEQLRLMCDWIMQPI